MAVRKKISQITSKEEEDERTLTDTDTESTPYTGTSINQEI